MKRYSTVFSLSIIVLLLASCSHGIGDVAIISTRPIEIGGKYKMLGRCEGSDMKSSILFVPLGYSNLRKAVDRCLEQTQGDFITNAALGWRNWSVVLYGQQGYVVEGDVWGRAEVSDLINEGNDLYELQRCSIGLFLVSIHDSTRTFTVIGRARM